MHELSTLADRVWYLYHCLPRDLAGEPPKFRALERAYALPLSTFSKTIRGVRSHHEDETFARLAEALRVTPALLRYGEGRLPKPTGDIPPRRGTKRRKHSELAGWATVVAEVRANDPHLFPPAAFRAGAELPVFRHVSKVTRELVLSVSWYAWETATEVDRIRYSTLEGRAASPGRRPSDLRMRAAK